MIGRTPELEVIERFLTAPWPRHLRIIGEAGIGKTTLLRSACRDAQARGCTVLATTATPSRARLPLASVVELLSEPDASACLADLTAPRRAVIEAALGLAEKHRMVEPSVVAGALAAVFGLLAERTALLIAVDDVQWLDDDSEVIVEDALARSRAAPIGLVTAERIGERIARRRLAGGEPEFLSVGPLPVAGIVELVRTRLGTSLSRAMATTIADRSGGNPRLALELADGEQSARRGVRVPATVETGVLRRLTNLTRQQRRLVELVALVGRLPIDQAELCVGDAATSGALRSGMLRLRDERLECDHPLTADVVASHLSTGDRRRHHQALADVLDGDARTIHAGLATSGPDETLATAHEQLAHNAARRAAPLAASELAERSARLSDDGADRVRRIAAAARYALRAGASDRARELCTAQDRDTLPSGLRAELALVACDIDMATDARDRAVVHAQRALELAADTGDGGLIGRCHAAIAVSSPFDIDFEISHATAALDAIAGNEEEHAAVVCQAIEAVLLGSLMAGRGVDHALADRANALEALAGDLRIVDRPSIYLANAWNTESLHDLAADGLLAGIRDADGAGDEPTSVLLHAHLVAVRLFAGDLAEAGRLLELARRVASISDDLLWGLDAYTAWWRALTGQFDDPAEIAILVPASEGSWQSLHRDRAHLAALVGAQRWEDADKVGRRALAIATEFGVCEPSYLRISADAIIARAALRDAEGISELVAGAEELPAQLTWTRMVSACGRAHLARLASRPDDAIAHAHAAVDESVSPFDLGRSLLLLGVAEREAGRRRDARASLGRAQTELTRIGAHQWVRQVADELARISGRRRDQHELTGTERLVAELAAQGQSNREIAEALSIAPRTVESHLSSIYRTLDVRGRGGLARALDR